MPPPTIQDIIDARAVVDAHLPRTPLLHSPAFSRMLDCEVYLKLECLAPIGSFKARGAINRIARLRPAEKQRGVITASTGNHGGAVAWAAQKIGAPATVVLPVGVPDIKRQAIADAGARIIVEGGNWNESCIVARRMAEEEELLYLEDGEDPAIMAGAGTVALDILDELPGMEVLVVPVGGGNLIAGCAIAVKAQQPAVRVVGVQSEAAPAVWQSWQRGAVVSAESNTFAGGIATTGPVPMAFDVMRRTVDAMYLVSDDELMRCIALTAKHHAFIVEGAAAAPLAAVQRYRADFAGKRVVLIVSGRNLDIVTLARALALETA
jgi:threonine dehydratase